MRTIIQYFILVNYTHIYFTRNYSCNMESMFFLQPSGDHNAPCACVMLECVAVEVDKQYNDTRIQVLTSPVAVSCRDSSAVDEGAAASRSDSERSASAEQHPPGYQQAAQAQSSPLSSAPGDSAGGSSEQRSFRHVRSAPEAHLADGFAVLMGLQLRMHAMFSREGLAHEAETLEYAWLIEVELGHVLARLNPAHVCVCSLSLTL